MNLTISVHLQQSHYSQGTKRGPQPTISLGEVFIPAGAFAGAPSNETVISFAPAPDSDILFDSYKILSTVFRITIEPSIVQPFAIPVKLSYLVDSPPATYNNLTMCLAYLTESETWACQDLLLTYDDISGYYTGYTDHFTDFSILLGGGSSTSTSTGNNDSNSNEDGGGLSGGAQVGIAIGVIILIGASVAVVLIFTRRRARGKGWNLRKLKAMNDRPGTENVEMTGSGNTNTTQ